MVPRTVDAGSSNRRLRTYNPFGCKIFAGENHPDSKYLGGFNDRTFRAEVQCRTTSLTHRYATKEDRILSLLGDLTIKMNHVIKPLEENK